MWRSVTKGPRRSRGPRRRRHVVYTLRRRVAATRFDGRRVKETVAVAARVSLQHPKKSQANHTRVRRYYDLAPVDDGVEVCGAAPAAWTTKKSGVTYACRVLGFERDRPGCVDRLLARMRATAPGDRHTPGCGLFNKQRHRRPPA